MGAQPARWPRRSGGRRGCGSDGPLRARRATRPARRACRRRRRHRERAERGERIQYKMTEVMDLKEKIRHIPDFPKAGILFYDITTLLQDAVGFHAAIDSLSMPYASQGIDIV